MEEVEEDENESVSFVELKRGEQGSVVLSPESKLDLELEVELEMNEKPPGEEREERSGFGREGGPKRHGTAAKGDSLKEKKLGSL